MGNNKKKVLIFLTRLPYPPVDGTRLKILSNLIRGLGQEFDLEFCIVTDDKVDEYQIDYLEDNFGSVHLFKYAKWRFYVKAIASVFSTMPIQAGYYYFEEARKWFLANAKNYDAIYIHTLRLARYAEKLKPAEIEKIVIDFNDAISLNYKEGKKFASPLWRIVYSIEESRIRKYETKLLSEFKYFNVTSARDKQYLLNNYNKSGLKNDFVFENIRHGIGSKVLQYHWERKDNSLIFMGNLKYPPNTDAVRFFLKNMWPAINEKADFKFVVIGDKGALDFGENENVVFTGFVDDPYSMIAKSSVFVAPLRFGAGTPTKILEAMAIGIPVITTPLGILGIDGAENGVNVLSAKVDDVKEWIRCINLLIADSRFAHQLGSSGRDLVAANYTDKTSQQKFIELFRRVTE